MLVPMYMHGFPRYQMADTGDQIPDSR